MHLIIILNTHRTQGAVQQRGGTAEQQQVARRHTRQGGCARDEQANGAVKLAGALRRAGRRSCDVQRRPRARSKWFWVRTRWTGTAAVKPVKREPGAVAAPAPAAAAGRGPECGGSASVAASHGA